MYVSPHHSPRVFQVTVLPAAWAATAFSAVPITELFLSADSTYISVSRKDILVPKKFPLLNFLLSGALPWFGPTLDSFPRASTCRNLPVATGGSRDLHSVYRFSRKLKWVWKVIGSSWNCCGKVRGNFSSPTSHFVILREQQGPGTSVVSEAFVQTLSDASGPKRLCGISRSYISKEYF